MAFTPIKTGTKPVLIQTGSFKKTETFNAKYTHRYFCDSCTGIAFYHHEGMPYPVTVTCPICGKTNPFKKENLIKL